MTDDIRADDAIRSWMADSDHPLPTEPVVDAVLGSIVSIPQDSFSPVGDTIRRYAWFGLVAAAAVVAVAIGVSLLRPARPPDPESSRQPLATPTATPPLTESSPPDPYAGVPETRIEAEVIRVSGTETGYLSVTSDAVWAAVSSGLVRSIPRR